MTREIVTLQFGNYANYVGAHWWNIQESGFNYTQQGTPSEIDHDVLYRVGENLQHQTTYTPRLLLVDLAGSLKHLPLEGELYGNRIKRAPELSTPEQTDEAVKRLKEDVAWQSSAVEVVKQPVADKNDFQRDLDSVEDVEMQMKNYNLAESVTSWTDYLYARYHPRTVHVVQQFQHVAEQQSFDTYASGVQLWQSEQFEEDFCHDIRRYVEECDYLQGFQTLFDGDNAHGGLAGKCLEYLNDEYGKANFAVPLYTPRSVLCQNADAAMSDSIRVVNSALSFHQLSEQASLFVPLSTQDRVWRQLGSARPLRGLTYQSDNLYQTSAILAAFMDTISLRYRLKDSPLTNTLGGLCSDLNNYGRRLAGAALSLPFAMHQDEDLIDCLDKFDGALYSPLTPNCQIGTDYVIQSLCVRGIPPTRLKRPREHAEAPRQMRMAAYKCASVSEMFQLYLQCTHHASMAHVCAVTSPMPTRMPFPSEIYSDSLNAWGFELPVGVKRDVKESVLSVPTMAAVQSSSELGDMLETLHREAKRVKIAKLHRFKAAGVEEDDYQEALEQLLLFKDHYEDSFEL